MNKTEVRINLWSGPRNISTALMYSFAQRQDTRVYDEPLYGYYLNETQADSYHPGARQVLAEMELDGEQVVEMMKGEHGKKVVFFKQMTHHLHQLDRSFMSEMVNVILTRDPREMLPSFAKEIESPTMLDVGYMAHLDLIEDLKKMGQEVIVLDSRKVLENPMGILSKLCEKIGIEFDEKMLSWKVGPRPEDGSWAKYWYKSVHNSTGFMKFSPKTETFPDALVKLLKECEPVYNKLKTMAI